MKKIRRYFPLIFRLTALCLTAFCFGNSVLAQDSTAEEKPKPVPVTIFEAQYIIDNQTAAVPRKKVLTVAIQHRFGTFDNGKQDLWGIFGSANIRVAASYTPINNLAVGIGITKMNSTFDFNIKYALIKQMDIGGFPVSVTYFANVGIDGRPKPGNFVQDGDRYSYFNQIMIARKITDKFSVQVAPSLTHFNNVPAFIDMNGNISPQMNNDHFAISFMGRYKLNEKLHLIANYDQPITQHPMNNPLPNLCIGLESTTSGHTFQVFIGNSSGILQQYVNFYNQNDYRNNQFLLGFNITRKWNFN